MGISVNMITDSKQEKDQSWEAFYMLHIEVLGLLLIFQTIAYGSFSTEWIKDWGGFTMGINNWLENKNGKRKEENSDSFSYI